MLSALLSSDDLVEFVPGGLRPFFFRRDAPVLSSQLKA